jgi:pentatricopeptide repeat-containing protein PET309
MLERAAALIEPVSQVVLNAIETPIRSHRALSLHFFKHGPNVPEPPPWWPIYLNNVRRVPQQSRAPANIRNSSPSKDKKGTYLSNASVTRRRSRTLRKHGIHTSSGLAIDTPPPGQVETVGDEFLLFPATEMADFQVDGHEAYDQSNVNGPVSESLLHDGALEDDDKQTLSPAEQLKTLLASDISVKETDLVTRHELVWTSFVALEDQAPFAAAVMNDLSLSTGPEGLSRALSAFSIIPIDERTEMDYRVAVDVAAKRKRFPLVHTICHEATEKGRASLCRQAALLSLLRATLFKRAAKLWDECYDGMEEPTFALDPQAELLNEAVDLPDLLSALLARLKQPGSLLSDRERETLVRVAAEISLIMVRSGPSLSVITPQGLFQLFENMNNLDLLKRKHYHFAIRTLASKRVTRTRHAFALQIYRQLAERYTPPYPANVLHSLLHLSYLAAESWNTFDFLLQQFRSARVHVTSDPRVLTSRPSDVEYGLMMQTMARQGDVVSVQKLYDELLIEYGPTENPRHILPLIYVHAVLGDSKSAQAVFDEVKNIPGMHSNVRLWNTLLYARARSDQPHHAFETLDEMTAAGVEPDAYTFAMLLNACATVGDESVGLALVEEAVNRRIRDLVPALKSMIFIYCHNDEIQKAENLIDNLDRFNLEQSPVELWNAVLQYHAHHSDADAVLRLQNRMEQKGIAPNDMTYAQVIVAIIRQGKTNEALSFVRALHFERTITLTPFYYGLLMHGYQQEGNRDMVGSLFEEMSSRFPRVSPSAKLSMLKTQQQQGLLRSRRVLERTQHAAFDLQMTDALQSLERFGGHNPADVTTKGPQPGFSRRPAREAVPSIYVESAADFLAHNGQAIMAEEILNWYSKTKTQPNRAEAIALLSSRLLVAGKQKESAEVDRLWIKIVQEGLKRSLPPLILRDPSLTFDTTSTNVITAMEEFRATLATGDISILPGQRFLLMAPFGRFIQTLHDLGRQDDIVSMMDLYPELGYTLTAKHWNAYVQALCNSRDKKHQLLAWEVFSNVLLPHMPSLKALVRGDWMEPGSEDPTGGLTKDSPKYVSRDSIVKMQPARPVPSHMTVVWLASVLQDFQRLARAGDIEGLEILRFQYPELLRRIMTLPRHANHVQRGLLVRKKAYMSTPFVNTKIQPQNAALRGITQGKSIANLLPPGSVSWSHRFRRSSVVRNRSTESLADDLRLAETALGEIPRDEQWLVDKRRWETATEAQERVMQTELEYLEIVDQMSRDVALSGLRMSETVGDPVASAASQPQITPDIVDDVDPAKQASTATVAGRGSSSDQEYDLNDQNHHKMAFDIPAIKLKTARLNSATPVSKLRIKRRYDIISTGLRPMKGVRSLQRTHSYLKARRFARLIEMSDIRKEAGVERRASSDPSEDLVDVIGEKHDLERFSSTVPDTVERRIQLHELAQKKPRIYPLERQQKGRSWKQSKPEKKSAKLHHAGQRDSVPSEAKGTDAKAVEKQDASDEVPFAPWKLSEPIPDVRDQR